MTYFTMIHLKWIKTIYTEISLNSNCKSIEYIFPIQNCAISLLVLTYTNLSSRCHKTWFVPESSVWYLPGHSPAGLDRGLFILSTKQNTVMIPIPDTGLQLSGRAGGKSGRALLSQLRVWATSWEGSLSSGLKLLEGCENTLPLN